MAQLFSLGIKFVHQTPAHRMTIIPEPDFGSLFPEAFLVSELKALPVWSHEHYHKYCPVRNQVQNQECFHSFMPNQSPEPTAVGACRSAIAVPVAGRRWLSFLR